MIGVLAWIACAFVIAWVAHDKGRSAGLFFLTSLILSPLIGAIAVLGCRTLEPEVGVVRESPIRVRMLLKVALVLTVAAVLLLEFKPQVLALVSGS